MTQSTVVNEIDVAQMRGYIDKVAGDRQVATGNPLSSRGGSDSPGPRSPGGHLPLTVQNGRNEWQRADQTEAVSDRAEAPQRSAASDQGGQTPSRAGRRRRTAIQVAPPAVVAMDGDDERQAVTAIATMIASWWHDHQHDPPG